ncbi:cupin domain-containing protein [Haloferax marisrubri]|uniref:Cupin domain-containing protein n=1 Tax=Haloferax marisrubri TaxID=1544719 RepID=A0A2P4NPE7_9EURY|nr:cupin domain-containing protein [Haloferax marisrubri]POG55001.1 cupin domain-containing protein [Haloferax marisrubri]
MSYTKANYEDVDAVGGGLHFLRDELDCVELGFSVLEADPDWSGKPHDHAEQGHEEVYYLVSGEATLVVEEKALDLEPGDAVRVAPEDTRELRNGPEESTFVIAGAP